MTVRARTVRGVVVALGVGFVLFLVGGLALAPAAFAHNELVSSSPADGAVVARAPAQARLTFAEGLDAGSVKVAFSREGRAVSLPRAPVIAGNEVRQALPAAVTAGRWVLAYRVVSKDGHPVSGQITMSIRGAPGAARLSPLPPSGTGRAAPGRPTSSRAAARNDSNELKTGFRTMLLIPAGIAALALVGLAFYVFRGARRRGHRPGGAGDSSP